MTKEQLRREYKKTRDNVKHREKLSAQIANKLFEMPEYINAKTIGIYSSFGSEVDTFEIMQDALYNGKTVGVPKVFGDVMDFYKINSVREIQEENMFGIREPLKSKENYIEPKSLDLIIVPGLCFDRLNNRVGFGKGYYDRYLSNEELTATKIGICFEEQFLESMLIKTNEYDVKMDKVIY